MIAVLRQLDPGLGLDKYITNENVPVAKERQPTEHKGKERRAPFYGKSTGCRRRWQMRPHCGCREPNFTMV